jgi:hypothetical protein
VPEIAGAETLVGALRAAATTAVGEETAIAEPVEFDAVTVARSVWPPSADPTLWFAAVSPASALHAAPEVSQRLHWYP